MGIINLFIIMMLLQMLSGYFEGKKIQKYYHQLIKRGNVLVGRYRGNFLSGALVMFVLDNDMNVLEYHIRQGVSIFSKFHQTCLTVPIDIDELNIKGNKQLVKAIEQAKTYLPKKESLSI